MMSNLLESRDSQRQGFKKGFYEVSAKISRPQRLSSSVCRRRLGQADIYLMYLIILRCPTLCDA